MTGRARVLAGLDAGLIAAFTALYLLILHSQGNPPVYWFLALLIAAATCAVVTAVRATPAPMIANLVILAVCVVLGLLSIGILLVPAGVAGVMSYVLATRSSRPAG